jgi:hypothetical protein
MFLTFDIKFNKSLRYDLNKSYVTSLPQSPLSEKKTSSWHNLSIWRNHWISTYGKEYKLHLKDLLKNVKNDEEMGVHLKKIYHIVCRIMEAKDWEIAKVCVLTKKDGKERYFGYCDLWNVDQRLDPRCNYSFKVLYLSNIPWIDRKYRLIKALKDEEK